MYRANVTLSFVLLFGIGLASCRTSQQQARRGQAGAASAATMAERSGMGAGVSRDSLLMIEEKLAEVIDSLSSLAASDRVRIRALEQEVTMLRSRIGMPASDPPASYTPPQPSYRAPQNYAPPQNSSPPAPPISVPQNSVVTPSSNALPSLQDRYGTALRLYNDGAFEAALNAFRDLERDDSKGAYASNYVYWQGESYYALKRYNEALQEFGIVLQQYPASGKAAAAQFKIGETYERMGLKSSARDSYERLLADYPNSDYSTRAEARLRKLK
jgi:TolA-binding protein